MGFGSVAWWLATAIGMAAPGARGDAVAVPVPPPFVVALDPGHGGTNLGTAIQGVYEKEITLEIARRMRRHLARNPDVTVVMCRDADVLVPIRARVRCANQHKARVFLSIHVNASPEGPRRGTQQGFELFVLPPRLVDEEAKRVELLAATDADAASSGRQMRAAAESSAVLARRLGARLATVMPAGSDRGVKQEGASLDVLRGLEMAGVLVEAGFLDHPTDAARLTSVDGIEAIAKALAGAVLDIRVRDARAQATLMAPGVQPRASGKKVDDDAQPGSSTP